MIFDNFSINLGTICISMNEETYLIFSLCLKV